MNSTSQYIHRIAIACVLLNTSVLAEEDWAQAPANITIQEFLNMHFASVMGRSDSGELNSFNLVSFYQSKTPEDAFVLVIQTWSDSRLPERDMRREIRKVGDALSEQFKALTRHPTVRKRWPLTAAGGPHFIMKHVRKTDLNEVLAVTIDTTTSFDQETIKKAEASVKHRGGVWSW